MKFVLKLLRTILSTEEKVLNDYTPAGKMSQPKKTLFNNRTKLAIMIVLTIIGFGSFKIGDPSRSIAPYVGVISILGVFFIALIPFKKTRQHMSHEEMAQAIHLRYPYLSENDALHVLWARDTLIMNNKIETVPNIANQAQADGFIISEQHVDQIINTEDEFISGRVDSR